MENRDKLLQLIEEQKNRRRTSISLIASEGELDPDLLEVCAISLSNKYAEGYPGNRFYGGCENIDEIEKIAIEEAKKAFGCGFANVQCLSGSIANFAVYKALLEKGDKILSMEMTSGGHLTHSSPHSFVSDLYTVSTYSVNKETMKIDYDEVEKIALKNKPKLIVAGSSSYPFSLDFARFREIADKVGALLFADISHYSGLIAAGLHQSCFPHAHVAMTTTHKQLRGTRGAIILWNDESLSQKINKAVFPGIQGGMNPANMALNALALTKVNTQQFKDYMKHVRVCADAVAERFNELGMTVIGRATESHMVLVDMKKSFGITGKEACDILERVGVYVNPNLIPFDDESPSVTSGIRVGCLTLATLMPTAEECFWLAELIFNVFTFRSNENFIAQSRKNINFWVGMKTNVQ